jgi:hypothetical protein
LRFTANLRPKEMVDGQNCSGFRRTTDGHIAAQKR